MSPKPTLCVSWLVPCVAGYWPYPNAASDLPSTLSPVVQAPGSSRDLLLLDIALEVRGKRGGRVGEGGRMTDEVCRSTRSMMKREGK